MKIYQTHSSSEEHNDDDESKHVGLNQPDDTNLNNIGAKDKQGNK